ncbi:diguanylate cyclase [Candidatus Poribacteria bacterium]|nr:diguanylate cyclase [Candidatus Poribacteria bacterium]
MKKILLVEDSDFFGNTVVNKFKLETDFEMVWAKSMSEAINILTNDKNNSFLASILDFRLPDAPNGEIIDIVVSKGIPSIVFTGYVDKEVRDVVWSKLVLDYVLKEDHESIDYIISLLKHIENNPKIKIIVVDNSSAYRRIITNLLKIHQYKVFTAENSNEALKLLEENSDTKIVITEYNLPGMDGLALTHKIREKYTKDHLSIIGISSDDKQMVASRFLKYGANDFISKQSFLTEEFYRRITQNVENLEHVNLINEAAIKDYLTGLFNRRYFFDLGQKLIANADRGNLSIVCAMLDIDKFKNINDNYGHRIGDIILQEVASTLKKRMRAADLVARFGGDEFCILAVNMKTEFINDVFIGICKLFENILIDIGNGNNISITVSIGVCTKPRSNLDELIMEADNLLYNAKENGRNRIATDIE